VKSFPRVGDFFRRFDQARHTEPVGAARLLLDEFKACACLPAKEIIPPGTE